MPSAAKGKVTKKLATKKRKYPNVDTARAAVVVEATERAERGGARSGVHIINQLSLAQRAIVQEVERYHGSLARIAILGGQCVAMEESQPQGESQPIEQTEQAQEGEQAEETEQAPQPQLRRSSHTRALVTPRLDTQRRGSHLPPRP
jgi:hypothetical protein